MHLSACFSATYVDARHAFSNACSEAGLKVHSYRHPTATGPQTEALFIDVAQMGEADAEHAIVISSGTHGVEGFAGSGCQVALLHEPVELPPNTKLLFIHALNPYGFSHLRRVTENNVDLNRNFIDFSKPPSNPDYEVLHPYLLPTQYSGEAKQVADQAIAALIAQRGMAALQSAVQRGQYTHADGLFYGGTEPQWSHRVLKQIIATHLRNLDQLAVIDLHTGLGPRGIGELICAKPTGSEEAARAQAWYGEVAFPALGDSVSAEVTGHAADAYVEAEAKQLTRVTLEFGTLELMHVFEAVRADNWLHVYPDKVDSATRTSIKQMIRGAFYIDEDDWIEAVWARTLAVFEQCATALSSPSR